MLYNKAKFKKLNDNKALHKKGKRWIVVSVALLGAISTGAIASHVTANADAVNASPQVSQQLSNAAGQSKNANSTSANDTTSSTPSVAPKIDSQQPATSQSTTANQSSQTPQRPVSALNGNARSNTTAPESGSYTPGPDNENDDNAKIIPQGPITAVGRTNADDDQVDKGQSFTAPKVSRFINQHIDKVGSTLGSIKPTDIPDGYHHAKAEDLRATHPKLYMNVRHNLMADSTAQNIPVVGNPVSYKGTVTLHFHEPNGTAVRDIQLPYLVNSEVGNSVTIFDPSNYLNQTIQGFNTTGFSNDQNKNGYTFQVQPSDGPQHNGNTIQRNYTLDFTAKASAPITVTYHDQNGKTFTNNVSGYVDQQGNNITQLSNVPAGYSLNGGQNTSYVFRTNPQTMNEYITGNQQSGTVTITINKKAGNQVVGTYTRQVNESGRTGNSFTITPSSLAPSGYAPQSSPLNGVFTPNGLSTYNATFNYNATAGATVTVNYINQNNQNVGRGSINGSVDQAGSVTSSVGVPEGYTLNGGQNLNYKITDSPQTFNLRVKGDNANSLPDRGQAHITIEKQVNGQVISDTPQTVQVSGQVGNHYIINPSQYIPSGYSSISQPLQGTITPQGLSNGSAKFVYTANASDPIIVHFKNQDGNNVGGGTLNGTVDKRVNVVNPSQGGVSVPAGYTLNGGQNTNYTFSVNAQQVTLNVTGVTHNASGPNAKDFEVTINLVAERPAGNHGYTSEGMFHKTIMVPENGRTGDTYSISATDPNITANLPNYKSDYTPDKQDSDIDGQFTANGLSNTQGTFTYLARPEVNGGISVSYVDQNGHQVGSGIIHAYAGETIDDVTNPGDNGVAIPNGYTYASGNKHYTIGDSMQIAKITVVGNKISGNEHLTLNYKEPDGSLVSSLTQNIPVNNRVGDKAMVINPANYNQYGFNTSSNPVTINFTPNLSTKPYFGSATFNYTAKEAAPITVTYTNQNGQTFTHNVNGYFDQKGSDISKIDNVPAGYSINNGQNLGYQFKLTPQSMNAKVTGDKQSGIVNITVNKKSNGQLVSTSHQQDKVSGITGNTYTVDPDNYAPKGYAPQSSPMTGHFIADGIDKPVTTFTYDANAGAAITVNFVDQDKQNVGYGTIVGFLDSTGDARSQVNVPDGYQLVSGQDTGYKITSKPQNMTLDVLGENAQSLPDGGIVKVSVVKRSNGVDVGAPQTVNVPIKDRVGDDYMVNPTNYTPSGYTSISQPLQGTVNANGLSQDRVSFIYTANASSPVNITYVNQNNQVVGNGVMNGSVDQTENATDQVPIPKGYVLNKGQSTKVKFTTSPQSITYHVTGAEHNQNDADAKNYQVLIHLDVNTPSGTQVFTKDVEIPEFGRTGDDYMISPADPSVTSNIPSYSDKAFQLAGTDKPINGEITDNGLTDKEATFTYIVDAQTDPDDPKDPHAIAKPIHVVYTDASGDQQGAGYVNGYLDQTIQNVTDPADGGVAIPKGYQYASGRVSYTITTQPQEADIEIKETAANSNSHKDASGADTDDDNAKIYANEAGKYASATNALVPIADSIANDTPSNTAKIAVMSDDYRAHNDDNTANHDSTVASSADTEADSYARAATSAANADDPDAASSDASDAASLANLASSAANDAGSAYSDASGAVQNASSASASASESTNALKSASASASTSSKDASIASSVSASISASISAKTSTDTARSAAPKASALSSASDRASEASASADSYANDAEKYANDASAVAKKDDETSSVSNASLASQIDSDISDADSDAVQAEDDKDYADKADSRADSYASQAASAADAGDISLASDDASNAASENVLASSAADDAKHEDSMAHSATYDISSTKSSYANKMSSASASAASVTTSMSASISNMATSNSDKASSAAAATSSAATAYPSDSAIVSDNDRAKSDSAAVNSDDSVAASYAAKGDMSDADREASSASSYADDASAAANDARSHAASDSDRVKASKAAKQSAKQAAENQKKLDDSKFKKQLHKDEQAYRNAFRHGFHDAKYGHKIIKSHFKGQRKAYMAGYEAYFNGFYEGAQGKQGMNRYYHGFSRGAFMNGYLNGVQYVSQNGTGSLRNSMNAHNSIAKMTMTNDNDLRHYINQHGKLPQTSESTPTTAIVMAIALGISALSMLGYDDVRKHYLTNKENE